MNTDKPVVVVVARQRSGTTVLHRTLAAGSVIQSYEEIFHDETTDAPSNFFAFKARLIAADAGLVVPTNANQERIWRDYLAFARSATERPVVMIDVKYNSWHHLNPVWHGLDNAPYLVKLVRGDALPVVHLIRDNLFEQACSTLIAGSRSVFHVKSGEAEVVGRHDLSPGKLLATMEDAARQAARFRKFFSRHAPYIEIRYETLIDGDRISPSTYEALSGLTGYPLDEGRQTPLKKVLPDLKQVLGNADEIVAYFDQTRYADMVRGSLTA